MARQTIPAVVRFWRRVDKNGPGGCWLWTGGLTGRGYGGFRSGGRDAPQVVTHRFAYELLVGPIPPGLTVDHLCRIRRCVNPAHLEPVTIGENVLRGIGPSAVNARRTRCAHGHLLAGDNLRIGPDGKRRCRACARISYHRNKKYGDRPSAWRRYAEDLPKRYPED